MRKTDWDRLSERLKPFIGLILLMVIFSVATGGLSLQPKNLKTVMEQSMALMLATIGVFFVMTMGMMDLSISGVVCTCCYVMAKMCSVNIALGLVLTLATGLLLGLFNGVVTSVLKVPSFLATLCTAYICNGVMTSLIASNPAVIPFELYAVNTFAFKLPMVALLAAFAFVLFRFRPFGNYVRLIGCNETAANYSAINTVRVRVLCYVIDGGFAACAAFLIGIRAGTAALTSGADLMFNVMVALTLGGFSFVGGAGARISAAIIGSFTTYILSNGMLLMGVNTTTMQLVKGGLFLAIILLTSGTFKTLIERVGSGRENCNGKRRSEEA